MTAKGCIFTLSLQKLLSLLFLCHFGGDTTGTSDRKFLGKSTAYPNFSKPKIRVSSKIPARSKPLQNDRSKTEIHQTAQISQKNWTLETTLLAKNRQRNPFWDRFGVFNKKASDVVLGGSTAQETCFRVPQQCSKTFLTTSEAFLLKTPKRSQNGFL